MLEKNQLKVQGIRFGRSLQTVIKMATMYAVDHQSAVRPIQSSYDILNALVKQTRYITLGFIEQRVMINNILTSDATVKPLENEFLKRGIGAVTFEAGITLAAYKNALAVLAANIRLIEESGGLMPFLESHPLEFVRVFPASKNEIRTNDGDTVLEMSSEEYLISRALAEMNTGMPQGFDALLNQMQPTSGPPAPGSALGFGSGGNGSGEGFGSGSGPGAGSGTGAGFGSGNGFGTGSGFGAGTGSGHGTGFPGSGSGGGAGTGTGSGGYLSDMQRVVEQRLEASLKNPDEDPQKAYAEMARLIKEMRPDALMSSLNGGQSGQSKEDMTTEVFENAALRWAVQRLSTTPSGEEAILVEEQVFRVLMRSLQTTQAASRMAAKLTEFAKEYALPRHTVDRVREELRWAGMNTRQKLRELLAVTHYSRDEFRRALDLIRDLLKQSKPEDAAALGMQYLSIFENYGDIKIEEVGRLPELLHALAGIPGEFWPSACHKLIEALESPKLHQVIHFQVVNGLGTLSQTAGRYEDFELVYQVGTALERRIAGNSAHNKCCAVTLSKLLTSSVVDRIGEIFLRKKDDSGWIRIAAALLRWSGEAAIERLFTTLESEPVAANRLALIRLLSRIGGAGLSAARKRMTHPEWYVVRNACKILSELKDPELFTHLAPAFRHKDERVQKAALQAVRESRLANSAAVLAGALPFLPRALQEEALRELAFHKDKNILPELIAFLKSPEAPVNGMLSMVIQIISALPDDTSADTLVSLATSQEFSEAVRGAAQIALNRKTSEHAQRLARQLKYGLIEEQKAPAKASA